MQTTFMFSGQGSHYFQMGRALFERRPLFRQWMRKLDSIALELLGESVVRAIYLDEKSKSQLFDTTRLTHPAIFMVEYSLACELMDAGIVPHRTFGASLGSFAAAAVAGCISAEDALAVVIRQATILEACCEPGGMLAVLDDCSRAGAAFIAARSEVAAVNSDSHFVLSARQRDLHEIELHLKASATTCQRLPVSFAFHSRWIDAARLPFQAAMRTVTLKSARMPLACSVTGRARTALPEGYFWRVARTPMNFVATVAELERGGAGRYIDLGPSGTLSTFLKYLLPAGSGSELWSVLTPIGDELHRLERLLAGLSAVRA